MICSPKLFFSVPCHSPHRSFILKVWHKDWNLPWQSNGKLNVANVVEIVSRRVKRSDIWDSGVLEELIWVTFDLIVFKVNLLGSWVQRSQKPKRADRRVKRIKVWDCRYYINIYGVPLTAVFKVILVSSSAVISNCVSSYICAKLQVLHFQLSSGRR